MSTTSNGKRGTARMAEPFERDVVALFVQIAQSISLPRSFGEIYGALFLSGVPMGLDELAERLGISKGSVSQGLRGLREMGAVKRVYVPGDRRDFFVAEMELRRVALGVLKERIEPQFAQAGEQIASLSGAAAKLGGRRRRLMKDRVARLEGWQRNGRELLPLIEGILGE
jgi:DNA-binding transcriptional regulator GbsR (MarR family)